VISRQIQIAMGSVWSKSRLLHPNRNNFFSPFLPGLTLEASSPYPLNWFCFTRRGDDEIIDPEVFDCALSRVSKSAFPSENIRLELS
jgi:hypothetical protein